MSSRAEQSPYSTKPEGKSRHGRIVRELGLRILAGELARDLDALALRWGR